MVAAAVFSQAVWAGEVRGQRSVLCLLAEAYRAVSSTGADDVEDSSTGDPSGTAQVLRADGRYSHGE